MYDNFAKRDEPFIGHMWWMSPRVMHPECYKMGLADIPRIDIKLGLLFDQEDAERDGFDTVAELVDALGKINIMTENEVRRHVWGIIHFDWQDGYPLKPPRKVA